MCTQSSFQAWLGRVAAGDQEAEKKLFGQNDGRLLKLAKRMLSPKVRRKVDPEDIVQHVYKDFFVALMAGRFSLPSESTLIALLNRMTLNTCADYGRKTKVGREESAAPRSDGSSDDKRFVAGDSRPSSALARNEIAKRVMKSLSPRDRQIVELEKLGDTPTMISEKTRVSVSTVYKVLARATKRALREFHGSALPPDKGHEPDPI